MIETASTKRPIQDKRKPWLENKACWEKDTWLFPTHVSEYSYGQYQIYQDSWRAFVTLPRPDKLVSFSVVWKDDSLIEINTEAISLNLSKSVWDQSRTPDRINSIRICISCEFPKSPRKGILKPSILGHTFLKIR